MKKASHSYSSYQNAVSYIKSVDDPSLIYEGMDDCCLDKDDCIYTGIYCDCKNNGDYDAVYLTIDLDEKGMSFREKSIRNVGRLDYSREYKAKMLDKENVLTNTYSDFLNDIAKFASGLEVDDSEEKEDKNIIVYSNNEEKKNKR